MEIVIAVLIFILCFVVGIIVISAAMRSSQINQKEEDRDENT